MPINKTIKREFEVAFSRRAQPVWLRVLKYLLLGVIVYVFWGTILLWIILIVLLGGSLILHFWVRYKTHGWTQSYGLWKHDKSKPDDDSEQAG